MNYGTIKFYNEDKAYGFIMTSTGTDIFFHLSDVVNPDYLRKGADVQFDIGESRKGLPKAIGVKIY